MQIVDLPPDILSGVLEYLDVYDLLSARQTCRFLAKITRARELWIQLFHRTVFNSQFPSFVQYYKPWQDLTATDCENISTRSIRLQKHLSYPQHKPPVVVPLNLARSVTWARIIRGQWLLVASSDNHHSVLSLWALRTISDPGASPVTEAYLHGPVKTGQCDIRGGVVTIALELYMEAVRSICIVQLCGDHHNPTFTLLGHYDGAGCLRALSGHLLAFSLWQELSRPTVLNITTGEVHHLYAEPQVEGGAAAMAVYENYIATVSRGKLQLYSLSDDGQSYQLLRTMTFTHSLAFASLAFTLPSSSASDNSFASDTPSELRICISGEDGLHLYCLPRQELVGDHPESEIPSGYLRYSYLIPDYHERKHTDLAIPCSPAFDATSTALTWLQGPSGGYGRQYSFRTLVEGLPSLVDSEQQAQQAIVYELEHPDMPVLYAEGVYHYDAGLGVAVFGNMFGELALFDLSGCGVGTLVGALQPLAYPPIVEATIMPKTPIAADFGFPFPYCGPHEPAAERVERIMAHWKSRPYYPKELPSSCGYTCVGDDPVGSWRPYIPSTPRIDIELALLLEDVGHFYGTVVPLLQARNCAFYYAGGLLFANMMFAEDCVTVIPPSTKLQAIIDGARSDLSGDVPFDSIGCSQRRASHAMWQWKCGVFGRNRWEEMRQRGGDVAPSLIDSIPGHWPVERFGIFKKCIPN